jgi:pyrroline-5-carboxylate reductase
MASLASLRYPSKLPCKGDFMAQRAVGFVGGGRVTSVVLGGFARAGVTWQRLVVSDPNPSALDRLRRGQSTIDCTAHDREAAAQETVFLAVPAAAAPAVAEEIRGVLRPQAVLISLVPGISIETLSAMLGGFLRLARTLPAPASMVRAGVNPVAFAPGLPRQERSDVLRLLRTLGDCHEVAEPKLEPYALCTTAAASCLLPQLYQVLASSEHCGLSADEARAALEGTVSGTLRLMLESGLPASEVKDLAAPCALGEDEAAVVEMLRQRLAAACTALRGNK